MMRCLIHRWTDWGPPRQVRVAYMFAGKKIDEGVAEYQRRTCRRCGKVKEREVSA